MSRALFVVTSTVASNVSQPYITDLCQPTYSKKIRFAWALWRSLIIPNSTLPLPGKRAQLIPDEAFAKYCYPTYSTMGEDASWSLVERRDTVRGRFEVLHADRQRGALCETDTAASMKRTL